MPDRQGHKTIPVLALDAKQNDAFAVLASGGKGIAHVGGVGDRPSRLVVSSLVGTKLDTNEVTDAISVGAADLDAMSDLHASAAYRRRVAVTLCIRALEQARGNAAAIPSEGAR